MRQPNKAIKRERHIMPTIDDIILRLNGAKVFSRLDLNSGFHQLVLAPESRNITVFSSHIGLRRYKRLNMGLSASPEIFQNEICEALQGLKGCINISNDIIVFGKDQSDHDRNLKSVFDRLREKQLTLNENKCEFSQTKIKFFGYKFRNNFGGSSKSGIYYKCRKAAVTI